MNDNLKLFEEAYTKHDFIQSRIYLEKALLQGAPSAITRHNIETVKYFLGVTSEEHFSWQQEVAFYFLGSPFSFFINLFLIFTFIILIFRRLKKFSWKKCLIGILVFFLPLGFKLFMDTSYQVAIAIKQAPVYTGASAIFPVNKNLFPGLKLLVKKSANEWYFLQAPDSFQGWVLKESLTFIK